MNRANFVRSRIGHGLEFTLSYLKILLSILSVQVLFANPQQAFASPLDTGAWYHVARMSDSDAGMFDGNGDLQSNYAFGTYTELLQTDDFERPFDVYDGMQILFITGDQTIWAQTGYAGLRSLIDAKAGDFSPNIQFDAHFDGVDQVVLGNVLSRNGFVEDPWISLVGDHFSAISAGRLIWGEGDYLSGQHALLKNSHLGVNVFVSTQVAPVPLPASLPLFALALLFPSALKRLATGTVHRFRRAWPAA